MMAASSASAAEPFQPENYIEPVKENKSQENIINIQATLTQLGYFIGSYGATGKLNKPTRLAVRQFQKDNKLQVDGVVGPKTTALLNQAIAYGYANIGYNSQR